MSIIAPLLAKIKGLQLNGWIFFFYNYLYKYKVIHAMKLVDIKSLIKTDSKVDMTLTQIGRAKLFTIEKFEGYLKEKYGRF